MNNFATWLNEKLQTEGWSQNELARRSSISQAQVSNVINGSYEPGPDFLKGIARAFGMTRREVYSLAGLIEPEPDETQEPIAAMLYEFALLPKDEQLHLLKEARALNAYRSRTDSQPN